jgi:ATP-dependent helicase/nuclease subunit A
LDGGLDHILVDEAQDTSRAQWSIVDTLTHEFFAGRSARDNINRTLFVVGDEKQSIYSFQNADPDAFLGMYGTFAARIQAAEKSIIEQPLRVSFRSAPAILHAVDAVFADAAAQRGVSRDAIIHEAFHKNKVGQVELWDLIPALVKDKKAEKEWELPLAEYGHEVEPQTELASRIAATIKDWLVRGTPLAGTGRAIVPGDIMILLRRRGGVADRMVRALKMLGVPVTGVDRMRLIEQLPVMDALALAQFALLPDDDLNLACLLRSPFIGVSEEQLMQLAIGRRGTLWASLAKHADSDAFFKTAYDYLSAILKRADAATPFVFLAEALNTPCPGSDVSGRHVLWQRLGHDALDPLQELLSAALDFGARHSPSLQAFLHWLQQSNAEIKREMDAGHGGAGGANGGMVRIMTVHAAKGLEAPIVFLPDASSTPRTQEIDDFLWFDDHETSVPFFITSAPQFGVPHQLHAAARQKQMEEYRRLLYVAMTRPENRLIIAGWESKNTQEKTQSWHALAERALATQHEAHLVDDKAVVKPKYIFADVELKAEAGTKKTRSAAHAMQELPAWARHMAPVEVEKLSHIAPSHIGDEDSVIAAPDSSFTRGRIIHRLLQSLPDVQPAQRDAAAQRYLSNRNII